MFADTIAQMRFLTLASEQCHCRLCRKECFPVERDDLFLAHLVTKHFFILPEVSETMVETANNVAVQTEMVNRSDAVTQAKVERKYNCRYVQSTTLTS